LTIADAGVHPAVNRSRWNVGEVGELKHCGGLGSVEKWLN